jgi:hypothetical protein
MAARFCPFRVDKTFRRRQSGGDGGRRNVGQGVRTKALNRAMEIIGAKEALRQLLGVSMRQLEAWLTGSEHPPMDVFLKAVDVIASGPDVKTYAKDAVPDSRRLRRESEAARARAIGARERALAIQAQILAGIDTGQAGGMSPLRFLKARFRPDEGVKMVAAAVDAAVTGTGADHGNLQLLYPEGLRIVAQRRFERQFLDFFGCVSDDACACGAAMKQNRRIVVPDVANDPIFAGTPAGEVLAEAGVRAVQSTPLLASSGELLGMLSTHHDRVCAPSELELDIVDRIARCAVSWLESEPA